MFEQRAVCRVDGAEIGYFAPLLDDFDLAAAHVERFTSQGLSRDQS